MATRLIWHGYLLTSTGSNLYTRNIARCWARAGHTVLVLCQDTRMAQLPECRAHVRASADGLEWLHGGPDALAGGGSVLVNPDIGDVLPVYVLDRYEGFTARRMVDMDDAARAAYLHANRAALDAVLRAVGEVEVALVNHVVLGPEACRPVLDEHGVPMVVKVHGSELEYAIAGDESLLAPARSGLLAARRVLAGSDHIVRRTVQLVGPDAVDGRIEVVPPGVDVELFAPAEGSRADATAALAAHLADASAGSDGFAAGAGRAAAAALAGIAMADLPAAVERRAHEANERHVDRDAADQVREVLDDPAAPVVAYVGKLISQKGPQLALAALPLVRAAHPAVRMPIAGFGPLRLPLAMLAAAMADGDLDEVRRIALVGARFDGGDGPWGAVVSLLDRLDEDPELAAGWLRGARGIESAIAWAGCVGHDVLSLLWPATDVTLVPSIFPEAFGMVAAEAAACESLPLVAGHTGLGEVGATLGQATGLDHCVDTTAADTAVLDLAGRISEWLSLPADERARAASAGRQQVVKLWSWDSVAEQAAQVG